jgi:protein-tyrosine-phosphatase
MAEYMLQDRLKGDASHWVAASAGLTGDYGMTASPGAVEVLAEDGIDLAPHRSRPLDRESVDAAAVIVVMTAAHREQIRMLYPDVMGRAFLLKSFGPGCGDVHDPVGLSTGAYRAVRDEITEALPELILFLKNLELD